MWAEVIGFPDMPRQGPEYYTSTAVWSEDVVSDDEITKEDLDEDDADSYWDY